MAGGVTFELTDADICSDSDLGRLDTQSNGCSSYSDRSDCGKYDDPDGTGFVARDMCCQCGGGDNCIDTDTGGEVDDSGNGCSWYAASSSNQAVCGTLNSGTLNSNSMCCACSGGTDTSTLAAYRPTKDVEMRILYNSTSSNLADDHGRVAIDYFTLQVIEECYNFGIAPTASAGINDFIYKVGDKTPSIYTCIDTNTGGETDA